MSISYMDAVTIVCICICLIFLVCIKKIRTLKQERDDNQRFHDSILRKINAYILLADEDFVVKQTNYYKKRGEKDPGIPKQVGELLRCKPGIDIGGCPGNNLCQDCPLKIAITRSFAENNDFEKVELLMRLYLNDEKTEYKDAYITIAGKLVKYKNRSHILLTIYNVTAHKEQQFKLEQKKLRAEQADRLKSAFLANISHEIRTPLNAITGFSGLLGLAQNEEEREEYITIINFNVEQLLQLFNDVLDYSKLEAGTVEFTYSEVNLNQIFDELTLRFQNYYENIRMVQVRFLPEKEEFYLYTDYEHVLQVLDNFLSNALKFTTQGSITIGYKVHPEHVYCYVQDTGPGLSKENQERVFDRFVKLFNKPGNGLGLSICKKIIKNLRGGIGVVSEVGEGATFWFTLPIKDRVNRTKV